MERDIGISRGRVTVIRNGVDLSRFAPPSREARRAIGLSEDTVVVGTVGRLVEVKNHEALVDAAASLAANGVRCAFIVAGEGPLRPVLEGRIRELGLGGTVRLLGHRPDIQNVFGALDVFVLPSRSEGMSNTILEAMASSLPVVACHQRWRRRRNGDRR
jgi:glycosyltransferase involved in cell wall biosynthesis